MEREWRRRGLILVRAQLTGKEGVDLPFHEVFVEELCVREAGIRRKFVVLSDQTAQVGWATEMLPQHAQVYRQDPWFSPGMRPFGLAECLDSGGRLVCCTHKDV